MYLFVINEFYCVHFRIKWKWNLKNNPCTKKDFFSKCDKIRSLHLLKKSSVENFIFCGVNVVFEESLTHLFQKDDYMPCASWSFNLVSRLSEMQVSKDIQQWRSEYLKSQDQRSSIAQLLPWSDLEKCMYGTIFNQRW